MSLKTAAFITLGCKINQYETEAIREEVLGLGYREVSFPAKADVYVINSCAVTGVASTKSRRFALRAARLNPNAKIIVVGCATPRDRERLERMPQVAVLAGSEEKALVGEYLLGAWQPGEPFPLGDKDVFDLEISDYAGRTRAIVKVQDGCNGFCSFCVIPFLRGLSRSRRPEAVVAEVERLAGRGFREVVISGVHLQDYGLDLDPPVPLPSLLERVAAVPGLSRLRLSSLGPKAFSDELVDLLADPVFCPHWHIPLQSGSDRVLERMRRRYTVADFFSVVEKLRARFEDPAITTDVIVGHPGETIEDFERTLEVSREIGFAKIHVFPFSVREGTLASKMRDRVEPLEVRRRAKILREVDRELARAYRERFLDREVEVLVEGRSEVDAERGVFLEGTTERYLKVRFPAPSDGAARRFPGTLQPVRALELSETGLEGVWTGALSEGSEPPAGERALGAAPGARARAEEGRQ